MLDRDDAPNRGAEALELRGRLGALRRAVVERLGQLLPEPLAARPLGREEAGLPPPQPLEQLRSGAKEAAVMLVLVLVLGGAPRSRLEQQPSPALRATAKQHADHCADGRLGASWPRSACWLGCPPPRPKLDQIR